MISVGSILLTLHSDEVDSFVLGYWFATIRKPNAVAATELRYLHLMLNQMAMTTLYSGSRICEWLTHPAYDGAYAYGKTEQLMQYDDGQPHRVSRRKPRDRWLALISRCP